MRKYSDSRYERKYSDSRYERKYSDSRYERKHSDSQYKSTSDLRLEKYGFETLDSHFNPEDVKKFNENYKKAVEKRKERWGTVDDGSLPMNRKTKRFVRKGIPQESRAKRWKQLAGYENNDAAAVRFRKALEKDIGKELVNLIDTDVPRTFPENKHFASNRPSEMKDKLQKVLRAFAADNPEIGYCQGLNIVAAVILLVVNDEVATFHLLQFLIDKRIAAGYYKPDMYELKRDCQVLSSLVKEKLPKLSGRLEKEGISFIVISTKWFICLYCDTIPFETSLRVLDCLFYEGDKILFRVGLTLLSLNAKELEKCETFPSLLTSIQKMVKDNKTLNCHEFMQKVFTVPGSLSKKKIEKLRNEYKAENSKNGLDPEKSG